MEVANALGLGDIDAVQSLVAKRSLPTADLTEFNAAVARSNDPIDIPCPVHTARQKHLRRIARAMPAAVQWQTLLAVLNVTVDQRDVSEEIGIDVNLLFAPIIEEVQASVVEYTATMSIATSALTRLLLQVVTPPHLYKEECAECNCALPDQAAAAEVARPDVPPDHLARAFRRLVAIAFNINRVELYVNSEANGDWIDHHLDDAALRFEKCETEAVLEAASIYRGVASSGAPIASGSRFNQQQRINTGIVLGQLAAAGYKPLFHLLWHLADNPTPFTTVVAANVLASAAKTLNKVDGAPLRRDGAQVGLAGLFGADDDNYEVSFATGFANDWHKKLFLDGAAVATELGKIGALIAARHRVCLRDRLASVAHKRFVTGSSLFFVESLLLLRVKVRVGRDGVVVVDTLPRDVVGLIREFFLPFPLTTGWSVRVLNILERNPVLSKGIGLDDGDTRHLRSTFRTW